LTAGNSVLATVSPTSQFRPANKLAEQFALIRPVYITLFPGTALMKADAGAALK